MAAIFALRKVTTAQLQELTKTLWSWQICIDCQAGTPCTTPNCTWYRSTVLGSYFEFFKSSAYNYKYNLTSGQSPGLACFEDLLEIIKALKAYPEYTKAELLEALFPDRPARADQERALDLAAQVVMMINCSASRQSSVLMEYGTQGARWYYEDCYISFLHDIFPKTAHPSIDEMKNKLRATKLKKQAGLRFQATNDLRNHLRLDRKTGVVEIFHQTAFLKEQLRLSKEIPSNMSANDLIIEGVLPRALALEVLDSIQKILFPLADIKTKELLLTLTSPSTCNFDTDMLRYESASIRNQEEQNIQYHYFGARLADLHQELTNPTPRGLEKWFERKSSPRFVMMATIAGVMFAIFLGLMSLALGGFQAYFGYMAWKHPVQAPSGS
ncbi:hypothetical protein BELL_0398g00140 [Botrytis elliptica]|uniref:Uncharacterized protein n=1 Tax=Botrytis elliptica TaxID=278938 RepID=A0A4Z1JH64_9HELO|nr:hypothetical protein EAE99_003182 [Botrytis elliptica]TGO73025.1 hypothetical protein BELL_0398g00140 [Botrytis elliptica]